MNRIHELEERSDVKKTDIVSFSHPRRRDEQRNDPLSGEHNLLSLERRLDDGYRRIDSARLAGEDITAWEDFWIELLRQYECAVDDLSLAA